VMQDEKLKGGFNAIGMSQGGQFMWVKRQEVKTY
jgi:hypothetical protein